MTSTRAVLPEDDDGPGALLTEALPAIVAAGLPARGFYECRAKRVIDAVVGALLMLLSLPLLVLVGIAVLVTSGRPVLYGSERVGLNGCRFVMWKFRTMVVDADHVYEAWKTTHPHLVAELRTNWRLLEDPRVTPLGRFLRRSSLDELPQLWNVLRGDMSLVGPRPYLPGELTTPELAARIQAVRPGLTGPFQVGGRKDLSPPERMEVEAAYAAGVGLWHDVLYMLRTIVPLVRMDGR